MITGSRYQYDKTGSALGIEKQRYYYSTKFDGCEPVILSLPMLLQYWMRNFRNTRRHHGHQTQAILPLERTVALPFYHVLILRLTVSVSREKKSILHGGCLDLTGSNQV